MVMVLNAVLLSLIAFGVWMIYRAPESEVTPPPPPPPPPAGPRGSVRGDEFMGGEGEEVVAQQLALGLERGDVIMGSPVDQSEPSVPTLTRKQMKNSQSVADVANGEESSAPAPRGVLQRDLVEKKATALNADAILDPTPEKVAAAESATRQMARFVQRVYAPIYERGQFTSWADKEPSSTPHPEYGAPNCTRLNPTGMWQATPCRAVKTSPLCQTDSTGRFFVPIARLYGDETQALVAACGEGGGHFARPRTLAENQEATRKLEEVAMYGLWINQGGATNRAPVLLQPPPK